MPAVHLLQSKDHCANSLGILSLPSALTLPVQASRKCAFLLAQLHLLPLISGWCATVTAQHSDAPSHSRGLPTLATSWAVLASHCSIAPYPLALTAASYPEHAPSLCPPRSCAARLSPLVRALSDTLVLHRLLFILTRLFGARLHFYFKVTSGDDPCLAPSRSDPEPPSTKASQRQVLLCAPTNSRES